MTMYPGAYQSADPTVPADASGVYPALAGYTPMDTGRRIAVAVVDAIPPLALSVVFYVFILASLPSYSSYPSRSASYGPAASVMVVSWVLLAAVGIAQLWAVFAKSSRLSGVFMGAQYVDVVTGRPSGGKAFGKWLLTGLIGGISLGIAPLVMYFATVQEPLKRNWFDRTLGLMLVDTRTGRRPGDPMPQPQAAPPQPPAIAAVGIPSAFAAAAPSQPSTPAASRVEWTPAPVDSVAPAIVPIMSDGGVITSTPTSGGVPTPPSVAAPPSSVAPPVIVRAMRSVDAGHADKTMLAGDPSLVAPAASAENAYLDGDTLLGLEPPTVLGRNPLAPGSHPDAVRHVVEDRLASKTHLIVGRDDQGPWVIDLHSTNGVKVAKAPGAEPVRIEAGRKVHLGVGATAEFGEHRITVR